jgi:predicted amidohydrolase
MFTPPVRPPNRARAEFRWGAGRGSSRRGHARDALTRAMLQCATILLALATTPKTPLRVLGLQLAAARGDTSSNLRRAAALIENNPGFDLYVLPELSSHGYDDAVLSCLDEHAQPIEGASSEIVNSFQHLARAAGAAICFGLLRRTLASGVTICQAVVDATGEVTGIYDKMHLCNMGDCSEVGFGLTAGCAPGVFECAGWRVGLTICYDVRFPELWRELAWQRGCDLILHPSAFVRDATFACYHAFVTTRAVENGVYVLSVNHAGERFGASIAAPPWVGAVPGLAVELAPATLGTEEGVLPLVVQPDHLAAVRAAYPYRSNLHASLRSGRGDS